MGFYGYSWPMLFSTITWYMCALSYYHFQLRMISNSNVCHILSCLYIPHDRIIIFCRLISTLGKQALYFRCRCDVYCVCKSHGTLDLKDIFIFNHVTSYHYLNNAYSFDSIEYVQCLSDIFCRVQPFPFYIFCYIVTVFLSWPILSLNFKYEYRKTYSAYHCFMT